jgi:hypothetical protein
MTLVPAMARSTDFHPLSAGAFGLSVAAIVIGAGAGIGAAFGRTGIGVAVGAVLGVPASIGAIVLRYRKQV